MTRLCSIDGCGRSHDAQGFCTAHWKRWRKHGDPLAGGTPRGNSAGSPARYLREVVLTYDGDECLFWPFGKDGHGYAEAKVDGRMVSVHRFVCQKAHGDPPSTGLDAAHSCGKGHLACVTKQHLSWKARAENEADKLIHGTKARRG